MNGLKFIFILLSGLFVCSLANAAQSPKLPGCHGIGYKTENGINYKCQVRGTEVCQLVNCKPTNKHLRLKKYPG